MNKITKEVKIGIAFVVALILVYFGINFLKGVDLFKPSNVYHVAFDDVTDLLVANSVTINGMKVGQVYSMELDKANPKMVVVTINLDKDVKIPVGSEVAILGSMLSGATIVLEPKAGVTEYYTSEDIIQGTRKSGLMTAAEDMLPKVEALLPKIDSILTNIEKLTADPALHQTLSNVNTLTAELAITTKRTNVVLASLSADLPKITNNLVTTTDNVAALSNQAKGIDIVRTFNKLDATIGNFEILSSKLTSKDNSLGLLLNDTKTYEELNNAVGNASLLMEDVRKNPSKYINVKVF